MAKDKRDITTSPRVEEMRRKRRKRIYLASILYLIFFAVIVVGLSFFSTYQKFVIKDIVVEGVHIVDGDEVKEKVFKDISGSYLHLFSKANIFIYPKNYLEKELVKTFPRIEEISISKVDWRTINIKIIERTGSYMWCGSTLPEDITKRGDDCYFINSDGIIFDKAPYFSGNVYFRFYTPIENIESPLNQRILSPEIFRKVISFVDGLQTLDLKAIYVVMGGTDDYAFYLESSVPGNEPKILFTKENTLDTIFGNLSSAMNKKEFKSEIVNKYSTLLYIDLRFKNKVLYKFSAQGGSTSSGQ